MVREIQATTVLNKHKKRDDWFLDDYSVNPYQGCTFNCIYWYTRGSKYEIHLGKDLSVKINAYKSLGVIIIKEGQERGIWDYLFGSRSLCSGGRRIKGSQDACLVCNNIYSIEIPLFSVSSSTFSGHLFSFISSPAYDIEQGFYPIP